MNYKYNEKDLLINKEQYMYSEFNGKVFLSNYRKSRLKFISKINMKKTKDKDAYFIFLINIIKSQKFYKRDNLLNKIIKDNLGIKSKNIKDNKNKKIFKKCSSITTNELLDYLIVEFIEGHYKSENINYTESLIGKYEITKRLYRNYSNNFRKIGKSSLDIQLYKKFSLLLSVIYSDQKEIRYLSTLLKVNDAISSSQLSLTNLCHQELYLIFSFEKIFITELLKKNKIKI